MSVVQAAEVQQPSEVNKVSLALITPSRGGGEREGGNSILKTANNW